MRAALATGEHEGHEARTKGTKSLPPALTMNAKRLRVFVALVVFGPVLGPGRPRVY